MEPFLKKVGFANDKVFFVPISGLKGVNLIEKPNEEILNSWYSGPYLLEILDAFNPPNRGAT